MTRVLKSGGVLALRTPDWGGNRLYPDLNDLHHRFMSLHERLFRRNQSDPFRGRHLGQMLDGLGFVDLTVTSSYTCYGTCEKVAYIAQALSDYILGPSRVELIYANGWGTPEEIEQIRTDLLAWGQMPGAFHLRAWIEVVARKP